MDVLDGADVFDEVAGGDHGGTLIFVHVLDGGDDAAVGGHGDVLGLKADAGGADFLQLLHEPFPAGDLEDFKVWGLIGGLLGIAEVGGEDGAFVGDEEPPGGADEAGEILAVFGGGNEDGVEFLFRKGRAESVQSIGSQVKPPFG